LVDVYDRSRYRIRIETDMDISDIHLPVSRRVEPRRRCSGLLHPLPYRAATGSMYDGEDGGGRALASFLSFFLLSPLTPLLPNPIRLYMVDAGVSGSGFLAGGGGCDSRIRFPLSRS